jgi:hypothetical protein
VSNASEVAPPEIRGRATRDRSRSVPACGGPGASRAPVGSRGKALAAGSRGVSAHTLGGVRGAEPRDAEPKPLDHPTPKQVDPDTACATLRDRLRAKTTVRCPLGQQHPTPVRFPVGTTAPYPTSSTTNCRTSNIVINVGNPGAPRSSNSKTLTATAQLSPLPIRNAINRNSAQLKSAST